MQSSFELHLFHEVCNVTTNQTCTYKTILSFGNCLPQAVKKHGYSFQFYCLKITVYSDSFHFFLKKYSRSEINELLYFINISYCPALNELQIFQDKFTPKKIHLKYGLLVFQG